MNKNKKYPIELKLNQLFNLTEQIINTERVDMKFQNTMKKTMPLYHLLNKNGWKAELSETQK